MRGRGHEGGERRERARGRHERESEREEGARREREGVVSMIWVTLAGTLWCGETLGGDEEGTRSEGDEEQDQERAGCEEQGR